MDSFCFKRNSKLKKIPFQKLGACSNTKLTSSSLYYEPWHIRNPDTVIIRGIGRTLEYSKVRHLHPRHGLHSYFRFCFRHVLTHSSIFKSILTHIKNLLCSWHIQNPGIFLSQSIFRLYGIFIILF